MSTASDSNLDATIELTSIGRKIFAAANRQVERFDRGEGFPFQRSS